jgi:hypothetical protein
MTKVETQAVEKYEIVYKEYREQFEAEVNRRLQDGWRLVGGVSVDRSGYHQAVTKFTVQVG